MLAGAVGLPTVYCVPFGARRSALALRLALYPNCCHGRPLCRGPAPAVNWRQDTWSDLQLFSILNVFVFAGIAWVEVSLHATAALSVQRPATWPNVKCCMGLLIPRSLVLRAGDSYPQHGRDAGAATRGCRPTSAGRCRPWSAAAGTHGKRLEASLLEGQLQLI